MNCERMGALLLAVVDGRATAEERELVNQHVAGCAGCARRMQDMRATWSALDAMPTAEPSPWFDARLRARLREPAPKRVRLGWLPGGARWAAMAALVVAIAIWISLRPPVQRPAPAAATENQDFAVVKNLPELENYDVISNFEALSALPGAQTVGNPQQAE
jgi:anti-sigma factor RsiW